ncbi:DUF155 domain containing protein [Niveomyces insectorum RCEF 264]|uniref:DUF155 domain containing protein n=1 Tax=Niveomyces insectorum RCEF 264 TaxID=1081102 RepID=A0A167S3R7_9HYPO|nr:DUF155 domain containing protein [Niveomyces insectorum RCEF 264]
MLRPAGCAVAAAAGPRSSLASSRRPAALSCCCPHARALSSTHRARLSYREHARSRPSVGVAAARLVGSTGFSLPPRNCAFHQTAPAGYPRRRTFFTSNVLLQPNGNERGAGRSATGKSSESPGAGAGTTDGPAVESTAATSSASAATIAATLAAKKKPRSAGAKHSLRRVAVIAQQQPPGVAADPAGTRAGAADGPGDKAATKAAATRLTKLRREAQALGEELVVEEEDGRHVISAVCLAESFDMEKVMALLRAQGFQLDPDGSGFESHEVVHARRWWRPASEDAAAAAVTAGDAGDADANGRDVDLFVFESGTLVGWGLPAEVVDALATGPLVSAAADPFVAARETETLEFRRDAARETSAMRGDVVVLGTRHEAAEGDRLATTRAQIAFSSGLARSTKLAVLERSFTDYFESTRRIPALLARPGHQGGGVGHLSQSFILQKTGELLSLRAQLNHYRELTDALPDIFWDARAELGLEGYYEQVGRALDVGVRIKTLNQKMDYAQEIATVLREVSSERHSTRLEWIIILLIAVEVVFELRRVYLERAERRRTSDA